MIIRPAAPHDAPGIAELLGQLGYPAAASAVVERLKHLTATPSAIAFVAELDGRVSGVVSGHLLHSIHATPVVAWLTTLVVDEAARSRGVGRRLAGAVEDWARDAGAVRISVTSGNHRDAAHAFYEHLGYARSGLRFTKPLA